MPALFAGMLGRRTGKLLNTLILASPQVPSRTRTTASVLPHLRSGQVEVFTGLYTEEAIMTTVAKVFKNGSSQAIRLPKESRFEDDEVYVKRIGSAVLVFPKDKAWDLMAEAIGQFDEDFMRERNQPTKAEQRDPL
jgi:antitoxin VapB